MKHWFNGTHPFILVQVTKAISLNWIIKNFRCNFKWTTWIIISIDHLTTVVGFEEGICQKSLTVSAYRLPSENEKTLQGLVVDSGNTARLTYSSTRGRDLVAAIKAKLAHRTIVSPPFFLILTPTTLGVSQLARVEAALLAGYTLTVTHNNPLKHSVPWHY